MFYDWKAALDAYRHWRKIGFRPVSCRALVIAKHCIDPGMRDIGLIYIRAETNMRPQDLL